MSPQVKPISSPTTLKRYVNMRLRLSLIEMLLPRRS